MYTHVGGKVLQLSAGLLCTACTGVQQPKLGSSKERQGPRLQLRILCHHPLLTRAGARNVHDK